MKSKNKQLIQEALRQRTHIEKQIRRLILEDIGECRPRIVSDKDRYLCVVWKSNGTEFTVSEPVCMNEVAAHYGIELDEAAREKLFSKLLRLVNGDAQ